MQGQQEEGPVEARSPTGPGEHEIQPAEDEEDAEVAGRRCRLLEDIEGRQEEEEELRREEVRDDLPLVAGAQGEIVDEAGGGVEEAQREGPKEQGKGDCKGEEGDADDKQDEAVEEHLEGVCPEDAIAMVHHRLVQRGREGVQEIAEQAEEKPGLHGERTGLASERERTSRGGLGVLFSAG